MNAEHSLRVLSLVCLSMAAIPAQESKPTSQPKRIVVKRAPLPQWQEVAKAPAWVAAPPARADHYRFVTTRRSNLADIARARATNLGKADSHESLLEHLLPALGAAHAHRFATTAVATRKMLKRASHFGKMVGGRGPGNTLATAWILWEVPIRPGLRILDPALRGRAERAFLRASPPWDLVKTAPAWFEKVPSRAGWYRVALVHEGSLHKDTRRTALTSAASEIRALLVKKLQATIEKTQAENAADAAVEDLGAVHRAMWIRRPSKPKSGQRYSTTAWSLWEVNVERMQRAVGKGFAVRVSESLKN